MKPESTIFSWFAPSFDLYRFPKCFSATTSCFPSINVSIKNLQRTSRREFFWNSSTLNLPFQRFQKEVIILVSITFPAKFRGFNFSINVLTQNFSLAANFWIDNCRFRSRCRLPVIWKNQSSAFNIYWSRFTSSCFPIATSFNSSIKVPSERFILSEEFLIVGSSLHGNPEPSELRN